MNILNEEVSQIRARLLKREMSCVEVASAFLEHAQKWNSKINAYITLNEKVLEHASLLDSSFDENSSKPLYGIPLAIKDMFCTRGLLTTAGSKILRNFVPPYTATAVRRLEDAGALVLGKANQDEFAMGSSNETSHFGLCRNPWNFDYVPGGSSGGSAAAVAAGMAVASLGTDTGGSIRQPASFCGIVGLKPTYGRVSRYGIVAFASSLDQAGPMTRSVKDAALLLESMAGDDVMDSTTSSRPVEKWSEQIKTDLRGMKVGVPKQYLDAQLTPSVAAAFKASQEWLKSAGATLVEVDLPRMHYSVPVYYMVATSEASSNLSRYDGVRFGYRADFSKRPAESLEEFYSRTRGEGFGSEVKRRIVLGTFALSSGYYDAFYRKAGQVRHLIREDFLKAFDQCDVILGPISSTPAFKLGERIDDPLTMYMNDQFTTSANLAGIPGISVPVGFSEEGLPVGMQLNARHFEEQKLFDAGTVLEMAAPTKGRYPHVLQ